MSSKTFCDRCGKECETRRSVLHMNEMAITNKAEVVSSDDYRPIDLCTHCTDAVKAFIGPAMVVFRFDGPEMAIARAVPQPFYPADSPPPVPGWDAENTTAPG